MRPLPARCVFMQVCGQSVRGVLCVGHYVLDLFSLCRHVLRPRLRDSSASSLTGCTTLGKFRTILFLSFLTCEVGTKMVPSFIHLGHLS